MSTGDPPNPWDVAYGYGNGSSYTLNWSTTTNAAPGSYWLSYIYPPIGQTQLIPEPYTEQYREKNKPLPEGVEMKKLYEVYLVYGENRKAPIVEKAQVIADGEEDAKIKSGLLGKVDKDWDADYLTIAAVEIIDVKVKERPKEVKQV
jgi:hypothetical protein